MPKTRKDLLKRQIAHSYRNLSMALDHLSIVAFQTEEVHPELSDGLITVMIGIKTMQDVLASWVKTVWGTDTPNWESWSNLPVKRPEEHENE